MRKAPLLAAGLASILTVSSPAGAQLGYAWTYEELMQKADLVLIAECQSTADTGRRRDHPELGSALPVLEWEAVFNVAVALKVGQAASAGSTVRLRYYQFDREQWRKAHPGKGLVNSGAFLRLQPERGYLLFLKKAADGVYDPLSGHTFPNDSVYVLDRMAAAPA